MKYSVEKAASVGEKESQGGASVVGNQLAGDW